MSATVASVLASADLVRAGVERWRTPLPERASGVYVVAFTNHARAGELAGPADAPLERAALASLLALCEDARVHGEVATV